MQIPGLHRSCQSGNVYTFQCTRYNSTSGITLANDENINLNLGASDNRGSGIQGFCQCPYIRSYINTGKRFRMKAMILQRLVTYIIFFFLIIAR